MVHLEELLVPLMTMVAGVDNRAPAEEGRFNYYETFCINHKS